jgi:2-phosphosulfolactate phosphatase
MPMLQVHFLPSLVEPESLAGTTAVVIDVLRATTTIVQALAVGARKIVVCGEVEEARQRATQSESGTFVLGGERGGLKIDGFDLGNSPAEYTEKSVGGKTIIFTTTNGTRALLHCRHAKRILLTAFTNLAAVCDAIKNDSRVDVICAGTRGRISREDVLLAGAIVSQLVPDGFTPVEMDDQAALARAAWRAIPRAPSDGALARDLLATLGGRNLAELDRAHGTKLADDIVRAAQVDQHTIVPRFDPRTGRVTAL